MKKNQYEYPKSSFLGMAKDTAIIMDKILGNPIVLKLLYYTDPLCLDPNNTGCPAVTGPQVKEMIRDKQISNVPKIKIDKNTIKKSYLRVTFDSFTPSATNDFYRDHIVEIKIVCHFDDWGLDGYELRPYRIAGEIDSMLDKQKLTGIGTLTFIGADQDIYDDEYGGVTLRYLAVRGHEDDYIDNSLRGL